MSALGKHKASHTRDAGTEVTVDYTQALCGLRPAHVWALDLLIAEPCRRCLRVAASRRLEIPELPERPE